MNMVRKIIESTYDGRCTVTQRAECEKPNGSTGSKITVTQNGVTTDYASSGKPAVYETHQEVILELKEKWS